VTFPPLRQTIKAGARFIDPETMKGWVAILVWSVANCLPTALVSHQLQVFAGQGKFAGQRPTIYHCATQLTCLPACVSVCLSSTFIREALAVISICRPRRQRTWSFCDLDLWPFDLGFSACWAPATEYMSTDFGVDSSNRFPIWVRTVPQTDRHTKSL